MAPSGFDQRPEPAVVEGVVEGDAARRLAPDDREREARRVAGARRESLVVGPGVAGRAPGGLCSAARGDADRVVGRLVGDPGGPSQYDAHASRQRLELGVDVREPDGGRAAPARRCLIAGPSGGCARGGASSQNLNSARASGGAQVPFEIRVGGGVFQESFCRLDGVDGVPRERLGRLVRRRRVHDF